MTGSVAINLIPERRRRMRRHQLWRMRCAGACIGYFALMLLGVLVARAVVLSASAAGGDGRDLPTRLADASARINASNQALTSAKASLAEAESQLVASRAITDQPDWSRLLALLARKANGQVVLRACIVRPRDVPVAKDKNGAGKSKPEPAVLVNLSGLGPTQAAVAEFALRLEAAGLFQRVALLDTTRESVDGLPLVSFRIECTLTDRQPSRSVVAGGEQ